jgi:hypothetical protein
MDPDLDLIEALDPDKERQKFSTKKEMKKLKI